MKLTEALAFFVAMILVALFNLWVGASLGIMGCVDAKEQGYSHRVFKEGYRAYCEIREAK